MQTYVSRQYQAESRGGSRFAGPDVYTIFGALLKKRNTKLRIQN